MNDDARDLLAVQKTLQGDREAFHELVDRYTPVVYSLAHRLLGSSEEAEDAVQEIFLRVYRSLKRFKITARFYTWLYTISLNWLRSRMRSRRREILQDLPDPEILPGGEDPLGHIVQKDQIRLIRKAITQLPPKYREVFVLRQTEELPVKQIAQVLDLPEGTVKTRLHRARNRIIDIISEGFETSGV